MYWEKAKKCMTCLLFVLAVLKCQWKILGDITYNIENRGEEE